jgi:hypothetical protein
MKCWKTAAAQPPGDGLDVGLLQRRLQAPFILMSS